MGKRETVADFTFLGSKIRWWLQPWNLKTLTPWKESYDQPRQHVKKQRHYFANKGLSSQGYDFSSSHVWMWNLDLKKAEHQRIDACELWCWRRILRVPWTTRRSKSILKISPGCSLEGLMLKLKLQTLATSWEEFGKDPDAGKNWGQKEKGTTEEEMVGWHHQLNGHGFGYPPGVDDGQGGLVCCGSWGHKESDTTKWLNWIELIYSVCVYIYLNLCVWERERERDRDTEDDNEGIPCRNDHNIVINTQLKIKLL